MESEEETPEHHGKIPGADAHGEKILRIMGNVVMNCLAPRVNLELHELLFLYKPVFVNKFL